MIDDPVLEQLDDGVILNDERQLLLTEPLEHRFRFTQIAVCVRDLEDEIRESAIRNVVS